MHHNVVGAFRRGVQQPLVHRDDRRDGLAAPPPAGHSPGAQRRPRDVPPGEFRVPPFQRRRKQHPAGLLPPPRQKPLCRLSVGRVGQRQHQPVALYRRPLGMSLLQHQCHLPAHAGQHRPVLRRDASPWSGLLPAPPGLAYHIGVPRHKFIHRLWGNPPRRGHPDAPIRPHPQVHILHPLFLPFVA